MNDIVSSYKERSELLFSQWKAKNPSESFQLSKSTLDINHQNDIFITDGVVCPEKWFSNKVRPLFLLKEAYGGDKNWDLINDWLLSGNRMTKMWNRVALWTKGILTATPSCFEPYQKYISGTFKENDVIPNIAVINVKKSGGKNTSNWEIIEKYAEYDKAELKRQIELCDPTIIICGYTSKPLEIILEHNFRENWNENYYYHITLNNHDVIVIDYWHPANQYPDLMNYYTLMNIYQLALKDS